MTNNGSHKNALPDFVRSIDHLYNSALSRTRELHNDVMYMVRDIGDERGKRAEVIKR